MKIKYLLKAADEARRFLDTVLAIETRLATDKEFKKYFEYTGSRETGSCKRASLDLTRALADLRKY